MTASVVGRAPRPRWAAPPPAPWPAGCSGGQRGMEQDGGWVPRGLGAAAVNGDTVGLNVVAVSFHAVENYAYCWSRYYVPWLPMSLQIIFVNCTDKKFAKNNFSFVREPSALLACCHVHCTMLMKCRMF